jgi:dTDP-4-amino-4,6-dideoxygalactose transaminase|uniref:DegT/DnrJ/EryC1/StrS family aminotransferase n=1 Tax=Desulfobacca acetoxidans TaxID=60893 RepID=A0A7C3V8S5_9BACT
MKVEFYRHQLGEANLKRFAQVMNTIFLTTGDEVALFEKLLAEYLGIKYVIGLTSATAGLQLSLLALGIRPGDEVITTPMTFVATPLAIMHANATPVFVDVEEDTGNLDVNMLEAAITPKTKAIMPVHLYGQMVDMVNLNRLARKHNLFLVEDAAHCLEGVRDNIRVGQLSETACYSFYATKSITCGEGGAVSTSHEDLRDMLHKLRLHGMSKDALDRYTKHYRHYDVDIEGWKYNMYNLQAALLIDQIEEIEARRQKRERLASYYRASLAGCQGLEMPALRPGVKQGHHLFTIWVDPAKRDQILWALQEEGVGVAVNYRACHLYTLFRREFGYKEGDFPNAERIGNRTISLPLYASLRDEEAEYVAETVKRVLRRLG